MSQTLQYITEYFQVVMYKNNIQNNKVRCLRKIVWTPFQEKVSIRKPRSSQIHCLKLPNTRKIKKNYVPSQHLVMNSSLESHRSFPKPHFSIEVLWNWTKVLYEFFTVSGEGVINGLMYDEYFRVQIWFQANAPLSYYGRKPRPIKHSLNCL